MIDKICEIILCVTKMVLLEPLAKGVGALWADNSKIRTSMYSKILGQHLAGENLVLRYTRGYFKYGGK